MMESGKTNLVLTGFMATGKSTIGKMVAKNLEMPFTDTDNIIEKLAGRPIRDIFEQDGEAAFRSLEAEVCQNLARRNGWVISTGGGTLLNQQTRAAFEERGLIVCLTAGLDEIIRRIGDNPSRPLAGDRTRMEYLLTERSILYQSLPYRVDTTNKNPSHVAREVIALWQQTR